MKHKHKCKDNDNILKFIECDGRIEEIWINDNAGSGWIVIGYDDLRRGMESALKKFRKKIK